MSLSLSLSLNQAKEWKTKLHSGVLHVPGGLKAFLSKSDDGRQQTDIPPAVEKEKNLSTRKTRNTLVMNGVNVSTAGKPTHRITRRKGSYPQMRVKIWNRVLPCTYAPRLKMEVAWYARNWLITCTWTLNPLSRAAELIGRFWKKTSSYFERKGRYVSRKISLEQLIVSGICCWRQILLRRFFRADQLLSTFVDSELQRCYFWRATWLHLELRRSSQWNVDLDLHRCSDQNRYAFPLIARFEKLCCIEGKFRQEFNFVAFVKAIFWLN